MSDEEDSAVQETEWESADHEALAEDYLEHETEAAERRARGNLVSMKEPGEYIFRPMPAIKGTGGKVVHRVWVHYLKNPFDLDPNAKGKPCLCPAKNDGKPCEACKRIKGLWQTVGGDKKLSEVLKGLGSKEHYFMGVITLACPEEMKPKMMRQVEGQWLPTEPKILTFPTTIYEPLFDRKKGIFFAKPGDEDTSALSGDFTDPEKGFNLIMTRKGKGKNDTEYTVVPARRTSKIGSYDWLKKLKPIDKVHEALEAPQMAALLEGRAIDGSDPNEFPPGADQKKLEGQQEDLERLVEDPLIGDEVPLRVLRARGREPVT